ncbi:5-bromo-4-chloroindolyl phosphate hydrolysis family protein [Gemmiger sp.]
MSDNKNPKHKHDYQYSYNYQYKYNYNLGDMIDNAVEAGSKFGSSVLGSIAEALEQAGDALGAKQPDTFQSWKRRLERKWKNEGQSAGVVLTAVGWTFTGCFGITALVMGILTAVGAETLGMPPNDFIALPILTAVFTPATLGFLAMAIVGMRKLSYFSRLRKLLRAANGWVCDLPGLARRAQIKQEQAYETAAKAVANGDLPNAAISDDFSTLYLDDSLMPTAAKPAEKPQAPDAAPLAEEQQLRREGVDFLNYLKVCRGKLGPQADEELARMQKTCASIMGFVHNHPEQQNRVRRFREYYLPTTRKLLDTAQGLGDTASANAAEIRRDITGILHTLNQAYEKLYDTLLQDVSMDVSTEIDTLEAMLRQDGLTHDFEADFNTRS